VEGYGGEAFVDAKKLLGGFAELAQALAAAPDEDARLQVAVEGALDVVARCDHAGITVNENGRLVTRAASDDLVSRANALQTELAEGPCLDVRRDQDTLVSPRLAAERRWPTWAPRVHADLAVDSMMSLLVYTDEQSFGALSLYCQDGCRFDADDVAVAQALAGQLSVIMAAERQIDQLGLGLHNRNVIGQAQGILMERFDMTANQAFDYLRRVSSHSNRKVATVAAEIAQPRDLPGTP
jgi:GAF domain-containing protein